jgi:S-adenosylmethionine:tRNA ribosyltransferase-isomerase
MSSYDSIGYFDYDLPKNAIAQKPLAVRDSAKMLCYLQGEIDHRHVSDLPALCEPGDLLVVNNTKVMAARLHLRKTTGANVEVLLLEPAGEVFENQTDWVALVKPSRRCPQGTILELDGQKVLEVGETLSDGQRRVHLYDPNFVDAAGEIPLPPYIHTKLVDPDRYQTVYAEHLGSVAAPTAGLHLTAAVINGLKDKGVGVAAVDLKVGLGTFRPIMVERILDHTMHSERFSVAPEVWEKIEAAQRVVAVGTTVVRTLESAAGLGELEGKTNLFINRCFDWKVVDRLLTNFHVPKSSLLVLVDAFIGSKWSELYREALAKGYRFLSFGDCMLLDRTVED